MGKNYWATDEGRTYKAELRGYAAFRAIVNIEALSKRSARRRKSGAVTDLIRDSAAPWLERHSVLGGGWPRPRADVALEIRVHSARRDSPRIDSICKWLLDELGGPDREPIVYRDDKQVKLLFARKHISGTAAKEKAAEEAFFGPDSPWATVAKPFEPSISIVARTRSDVMADIRQARDMSPPWRPGGTPENPFARDSFQNQLDREYYATMGGIDSDSARGEARRTRNQLVHDLHLQHLHSLDRLASSCVGNTAEDLRYAPRSNLCGLHRRMFVMSLVSGESSQAVRPFVRNGAGPAQFR